MRIRTIKPDFWTSAKVTSVSRDARLFFIGLLNDADDFGRLHGSAKRLAGLLFPDDSDVDARKVEGWLSELARARMVTRYEVAGQVFVHVSGFCEHQKIDRRAKSRIPEPPNESRPNPPEVLAGPADVPVDPAEVRGLERERDLGKGKGNGAGEAAVSEAPEPLHQRAADILAGKRDAELIGWSTPTGGEIAFTCLAAWAERYGYPVARAKMTTARKEIWRTWAAEGRTASACLKALLGLSFDTSPADRDKYNDWQYVAGNFELFARLFDQNEGKVKPRWPTPPPAAPKRTGPGREAVSDAS